MALTWLKGLFRGSSIIRKGSTVVKVVDSAGSVVKASRLSGFANAVRQLPVVRIIAGSAIGVMLIEGANIFCFPEYSDNVHIVWDPDRPVGDRIISFTVNGEELDPDRTYVLCSISFVFDYCFTLSEDHLIENMGDRTQSVKDCFSSNDPITEEHIGPDRYEIVG